MVLLLLLFASSLAIAEEQKTREIFVPYSDLHVLLQNQPKRVLIGRKEYEELLKKAERTPDVAAPLSTVFTAADYAITADRRRAEIVGNLTIDVLRDGLHALPLDMAGVGLRAARLDGRAASIGLGRDGRPVLFVEGVGQHRLELEMTAPLESTAARQVLSYRLPRPSAATLRLEVPGDVEIKGGVDVISRKVDAAAKVTRFELLPKPGDISILMTLNSHLLRTERAVIARSAVIDTVSEAYEQMRAAVTMSILHKAVDRFRFVVPEGFEITDVTSPLLSRWDVVSEDGRRVLEARLNEPTTEKVTLDITAIRAPAKLDDWTAPRLVPLDVVGSICVFGLKVDDRLTAESLAPEGLIPLDTSVLGGDQNIVAAYYAASGDYSLKARFVRPPAEMAATTSLLLVVSDKGLELQGGVSLSPEMEKRFSFDLSVPAGWQVTSVTTARGQPLPFEFYSANSLRPTGLSKSGATAGLSSSAAAKLPENTAGQASSGTQPVANSPHPNPLPKGEGTKQAGILPKGEGTKQAGILPKGEGTGHSSSLQNGEGTERAGRVRVSVLQGMKVGDVFSARFVAVSTPKGWLDDWRKKTVDFPDFAVLDASESEGAIAVESRDDIAVQPDKIERLTSLGADDRTRFGLAGPTISLAYRRPAREFTATLTAKRTEPRLTARSISFFRVDREALYCHSEVNFTVEQSRVRQFVISLPADTPETLNIVGLDGVKLKEYTGKVVEGRRRWTVLLAEPRRGRVRLAVDFQQRLPASEAKDYALPIVEADGVSYQSGLVAVEGCAELEVDVKASLRRVDVGELAEADYQPGRRLLGAYEFVGNPPSVKIDVVRRKGYEIPSAIVEKCELDTVFSPEGWSRHQAVFQLRSKALFVRVELPRGAKLWAAALDGVPMKPQRDADGILIDLSAGKDGVTKQLKITYADDKSRPIALRGTLHVPAPKLFLHNTAVSSSHTDEPDKHGGAALRSSHPTSSDNLSVEIPSADMVWRLHLPSGYEVVSADGTLSTTEVSRPQPAAFQLAGILYKMSGGIGFGYSRSPPVKYASAPPECVSPTMKTSAEKSPERQFVGRITGMKDCQWADTGTASMMGASTPLGRKYSLASGLMELTTNVGAKMILEGPCSFTVDSPNGGYLALGRTTVKNSNPTGDYVLRTPTAVVTAEPQAEVGVEVSADGKTVARTFSGRVRMLSNDNGKEYVMDNHGAATVIRGSKYSPTPTHVPEPRRFTRSMAEKPNNIDKLNNVAGGGGQREKHEPFRIPEPSAAEKKIEAAMNTRTQIEFIKTPLQDVIDYLKDFHQIEIQIDKRALSDVGIGTDTPITINLKGVSLRSALRQMLHEQALTYMIQDEVLLITTPEEAETRLSTFVYPVSELAAFRDKSGAVWTDFDSLIDMITSTVGATTWDEVGGPGTIAPALMGDSAVIVVSQTQEVHHQLEQLLDNLRKVARAKSPDGRLPIRERPTYPSGGMGGMGGMAGGMGGGMGGMAGEGTFGARGGKPDTEKEDIDGIPQPAPPAAAALENPFPKDVQDGEGENKRGETVGMSQPGVFNADLDIEKKEKERRIRGIERAIASKQEDGFVKAMDSVEESAIPFPEDRPIVYPDAEVWGQLSARRKDRSLPADISDLCSTFSPLSGVRSLEIDLLQPSGESGRTVTFRGLGVKPRLVVTLADDSRFHKLRLGLALAVALFGVAITRRKFRVKVEYILAVMLATTLGAMIGGLEIAQASNWMFFAAAALVPYYLIAGFCRWACRLCWKACLAIAASFTPNKIGATSVLIGVILSASVLYAGENANPQAAKKRVIDLPKDAIILPYDPDWKNGIRDADKLLVPYDKYVELWNRAYPDKKIETKAPPADFALADSAYKTTLDGNGSLTFAGRMQIDVFAEGYVQVPLGLAGGVLTRAELDGKPARLSVLATPQPQVQSKPQKTLAASQQSPERSVVILHVSGKGRHTLEIDARMKLDRQGGWRVVQGVLPSAPAAALDIVVPQTKTELRLDAVADCRRYETEKPDQTIRTALGKNGAVSLRWRPEVASGQIDRALTAASNAVFDVREDGLGLDWRLTLEFRNAERDRFDINLPEGYMLEKVEGANVRGWRLRTVDGRPSVDIELLQTAKGREEFTLRLWRGGRIGRGEKPSRFDLPVVTVADAALQSGRMIVRRSPLLELQTLDAKGVTRIDLPPSKKSSGVAAGPLGIRPFESYSFATVPFTVRLSAEEVETRASAVVESVLKLGEYEQILESRVTFDVRRRPVHLLRVLLPEGYTLNTINMPATEGGQSHFRGDQADSPNNAARAAKNGTVPGFHHTVTKQGNRSLLTVYLASGKVGETPLLISGTLKHPLAEQPREMPIPQVKALDVDRQSGDVAVQTDPSFDVELLDPSGCESVLQGRLHDWLNPNQREITRLALHTTGGDYSGKLRLTPRKPDITCTSITNVRVTPRAIEETILLNYNVTGAGVRQLMIVLPKSMADCRISTPLMQRKTIMPVPNKLPYMDSVLVQIELQEEAMGDIRVLIENDRLLTAGSHETPIPVILNKVRENRRYVVLENAGRGEIVVERDKSAGVESLGSHGKDWAILKDLFGDKITMAYLVTSGFRPKLSFHVATHTAVDTVKASIGLAETTLVMDAAGAYRAEVMLKVNNETEQYLDVQLPPGASLWTAQVAGEPVKPTLTAVGGDSSRRHGGDKSEPEHRRRESPPTDVSHAHNVPDTVRIPLLKTAPGDLDYEVVLRYGGRMPAPSRIGAANFPMIRCVNITPALCNAKLYLPEQYRWFDFGGTMTRKISETELDVGRVQYEYNQLRQINKTLESGDKWAKARASHNLERQLSLATQSAVRSMEGDNIAVNDAVSTGRQLLEKSKQQAAAGEQPVQPPSFDNRQKMNDAYASQTYNPSKNVAVQSGANWGGQQKALGPAAGRQTQSQTMTVTPRAVIQEEEEKKLGKFTGNRAMGGLPHQGYDGKISDEPPPWIAGTQSTTTDATRDGIRGEQVNPESAWDTHNTRWRSWGGNGDRGRQPQQAQEAESLNRYQERLAKQVQTGGQSSLPHQMESREPSGYAPPPTQKPSSDARDSTFFRKAGPETAQPASTVATPQPTGLASLDFTLPTRGRVYRFTTPRGEQKITARYVSDDVARLSLEAAVVGFAIVVILLIVGMVRRGRLDWLVRPLGTWLMLAVGFVSLVSGFLPVAAIVLIVVAFVLKIRWLTMDDSLKRKHAV